MSSRRRDSPMTALTARVDGGLCNARSDYYCILYSWQFVQVDSSAPAPHVHRLAGCTHSRAFKRSFPEKYECSLGLAGKSRIFRAFKWSLDSVFTIARASTFHIGFQFCPFVLSPQNHSANFKAGTSESVLGAALTPIADEGSDYRFLCCPGPDGLTLEVSRDARPRRV